MQGRGALDRKRVLSACGVDERRTRFLTGKRIACFPGRMRITHLRGSNANWRDVCLLARRRRQQFRNSLAICVAGGNPGTSTSVSGLLPSAIRSQRRTASSTNSSAKNPEPVGFDRVGNQIGNSSRVHSLVDCPLVIGAQRLGHQRPRRPLAEALQPVSLDIRDGGVDPSGAQHADAEGKTHTFVIVKRSSLMATTACLLASYAGGSRRQQTGDAGGVDDVALALAGEDWGLGTIGTESGAKEGVPSFEPVANRATSADSNGATQARRDGLRTDASRMDSSVSPRLRKPDSRRRRHARARPMLSSSGRVRPPLACGSGPPR
jgi:hypothetical protein